MTGYIARRLVQIVFVLFLVSIIAFGLIFVLPGDAALALLGEELAGHKEMYEYSRRQLGLDQPVPVQYARWLGRLLHGDLGTSIRQNYPVSRLLARSFPATLQLTLMALTLSLLIAVPAGVVSAVRPGSVLDRALSVFSMMGVAVPSFWLGIMLVYVFAFVLRLLPSSGYVSLAEDPVQNLRHIFLPVLALALDRAAGLMRQVRSSLVEVLQQEYIVTARAKGLRERAVVMRHALKNGLIPVVTVIGMQVGRLFGGSVIIETVFMVPGLGRWAAEGVKARDFPVVLGVILIMASGVLICNLATDIAYAFIDPRIRYG